MYRILVSLLIIAVPLGQFARVSLGGGEVPLYGIELLTAGIVLFFLITARSVYLPRFLWWLLLFLGIAFLSLVWGGRQLTQREVMISALYLVRFTLYVGLLLTTVNVVRRLTETQRLSLVSSLLRLLILSAVVLSVFGFVQLVVFPDFTQLDPTLGWDPHQHRLASTFFDPNFVGGYLVLALLLLASLWVTGSTFVSRRFLGVSSLLLFIALILTFSRSAYLMFAVAVFLLGFFASRRFLILALVAFLVAALLIPRVQTRIAGGVDPDDSARARFASWQRTSEIIADAPLLGVGFNAYRYAQEEHGFFSYAAPSGGRAGAGADSSLLFVWATTGVFGLLAYLLFYIELLFLTYSRWRTHRDALSLAVMVSIGALFVQSQFINALFYPWVMVWWFLLVGIYGGLYGVE